MTRPKSRSRLSKEGEGNPPSRTAARGRRKYRTIPRERPPCEAHRRGRRQRRAQRPDHGVPHGNWPRRRLSEDGFSCYSFGMPRSLTTHIDSPAKVGKRLKQAREAAKL